MGPARRDIDPEVRVVDGARDLRKIAFADFS
jgi:hypothetical protein